VCERAYETAQEAREHGLRLTLRAIFYRLTSEGWLVHSQTAYKRLSAKFARWREKHGLLDIIEDRTRTTIGSASRELPDLDGYVERTLESAIWYLENAAWRVPRWYGQAKYVEIWCEKDALVPMIQALCDELEVLGFPSRGYSSVTKMWEAAQRLKSVDAAPVILVLTDWDPSGLDIARDYSAKLAHYGLDGFAIERVAITPEQVARYDLPPVPPDDPRFQRVRRDPRYPKFIERCRELGLEPFVVEVDAFAGIRPQEFADTIRGAVNRHFDQGTWAKTREVEEKLRAKAMEMAERLRKMLER